MSNYSIVRIAGAYYPSIISKLYGDQRMTQLDHEEQKNFFFSQKLNYSDSFSKGMNKLGNSAQEILVDIEILQKKWAKENGIIVSESNWKEQILSSQIKKIRPDILYFQDVHHLSLSFFKKINQEFPFVKKVIIFRGFPGMDNATRKKLAFADILFVGSPKLLNFSRDLGVDSHLIYHSFDESILEFLAEESKVEFSFIGSSGFGYGPVYYHRYYLLSELLKKTSLLAWIDEKSIHWKQKLKSILGKSLFFRPILSSFPKGRQWISEALLVPEHPLSDLVKNRTYPSLFGLDMYNKMHNSHMTFNCHSSPAKGTVDNIRLFQATGVGTCLITDTGTNMSDLFEEDYEVITYGSLEECLEKVSYLSSHPKERAKIASRGQKKTLSVHTTNKRCEEMDEIISRELNRT